MIANNFSARQSVDLTHRAYHFPTTFETFTIETTELSIRALVEDLGSNPNQFFGIKQMVITGQKNANI